MSIITQFYTALYGFDGNAEYVIYGKGLASECVWMVPGTWED